jgi:hypothetical protein
VHTAYSDPPDNNHPFSAYYADACTAGEPAPDAPPSLSFVKTPGDLHGYRNATFEWRGVDDGGVVAFSYRLEPLENTWSAWGPAVSVSYGSLIDGVYTFSLRGRDSIDQIRTISRSFNIDTGPPRVVKTVPASGARNVPAYAPVSLLFSHPMNATSVAAGLALSPATPFSVHWNGPAEAVVTPAGLAYQTWYTVTLDGARRTSGQAMPTHSFSFETAAADTTPPAVVAARPLYGELNGAISITFSEPMDTILHRALSVSPPLVYTATWQENDTVLVLSVRDFFPGTYTVTVGDTATDKNGNFLTDDYSFDVYVTPPAIVSASIADGERNVDRDAVFTVTFSRPMNRTSVERSFFLSPENTGSYALSWNGTTLQATLSLTYDTTYTLTVGSGARDDRGILLDNPLTVSFSTLHIKQRDDRGTSTPGFPVLLVLGALAVAAYAARSHRRLS